MTKPNSESVTVDPCVCGYLARNANDSRRPIVFDELDKRYKYRYTVDGHESLLMIYHCPWCGGVASDSHQKSLFYELNNDACSEFAEIIRSCKTIDEVIAIFGQPNDDESTVIRFNEKPGVSPRADSVRVVTFRQIHPEMSVSIEQQVDGFLSASFSPMPIGDR